MTVCIAARCLEGFVFAASDRMLTAGDIQYEPTSQKAFQITKSVLCMMSGDAAFFIEILGAVYDELRPIDEATKNDLPVRQAVELFIKHRSAAVLRRSNSRLLAPLGLDHKEFLLQQATMSTHLVDLLAKEMLNLEVPQIDVIIAGIDPSGTHIYVLNDGEVCCNNAIGFACIGSGSRHAKSLFMLARHAWNSPMSDTLLLTYTAKRRAEVAPGVGMATDVQMIQPDAGCTLLNPEVIKKLEKTYSVVKQKEEQINKAAIAEMARYVGELNQATSESDQQESPSKATGGSSSTH